MNYETLEKEILLYKPNIVGISIPFTVMLKPALKLIKSVREYLPNSWVVAGGTHATLCSEDLYKVADYTVLGEGVEPMTQIIEYYKQGEKGYNIGVTLKMEKCKGLSELTLKKVMTIKWDHQIGLI